MPDRYFARRVLAALLSGLVLILAGCSTLPTQTFAPAAARSGPYDGFMAYAAFSDLGVEGRFEQALCQRLHAAGHACDTMLHAAPPIAKQTGASRQRAAAASGAQAVIMVELADPDTSSRRILAGGRPGYRISLIDLSRHQVVSRIAIDGRAGDRSPGSRAGAVADAVVKALATHNLLTPRP